MKMKLRRGWTFLTATTALGLLGAQALRADAADPHLRDPMQMLLVNAPWAESVEARLAEFERTAGIAIVFEYHGASPSEAEDSAPGVYMRALAKKRGLLAHGVLVVYFADEPDWRVWVGDELTPRFVGRAGTAAEFTADDSMHDAKEAMLEAAWKVSRAEAGEEASKLARAAADTRALADALMRKLAPRE